MKFWQWIQNRLGITELNEQLVAVELELATLHRKVVRKPERQDQIERTRSRRQHPARH